MNRYEVVVVQRRRYVVEAETDEEAEHLAAERFADDEPAVILNELVVSCDLVAQDVMPNTGPWA